MRKEICYEKRIFLRNVPYGKHSLSHRWTPQRKMCIRDRDAYGTGGCSHALYGADQSHANYDGKGVRLERGSIIKPDAKVLLKWSQVAKRTAFLMEQNRFLKPQDYSRMPSYEREQIGAKVRSFYFSIPKEVPRPWDCLLYTSGRGKGQAIFCSGKWGGAGSDYGWFQ